MPGSTAGSKRGRVKRFVHWLLAERHRYVILAVVTAPLLTTVSAALVGLGTARGGVSQGLVGATLGVGALALLALAVRADVGVFALQGSISFGAGLALGGLIRRTGNLVLSFQTTVLASLLGVAALSLLWPDMRAALSPVIDDATQVLRSSGAEDAQIAWLEGQGGVMLLIGAAFSQVVLALLLTYWWLTLAGTERRFGAEFRRLRLGRVLGATATLLMVLALVFDSPLVQNLLPLALVSFALQGLAVLHAWAHAKRWHPALLAPAYVLLVTPPTFMLAVFVLGTMGLVDNWFNLRASLRPPVSRE